MRSRFLRHMLAGIVLSGALFLTVPVQAGGLYLNEFATPSMGTAGAGQHAWAHDASTALLNSAGMTRLENESLMVGFGFLSSSVRFKSDSLTTATGGDGGDQGSTSPFLSAHWVKPLGERWRLGVAAYSIAGAALDANSSWVGRFQVQEVELLSLTTAVTVGYRVSDWFAAGGGVVISYGTLEQDVAVALPGPGGLESRLSLDDLDDVAFAFSASGLFTLSPRTRIGVFYQSELELEFSGKVRIPAGVTPDVDTDLPLVQLARASLYHGFNDRWALLYTFGWEQWSSLDNQFISIGSLTGHIPRNWDDTYHYSLGVHYQLNDRWMLQSGITYDTSPTTANDRTADLPVDRQVRLGFGALWERERGPDWHFSMVYADMGNASIRTERGNEVLSGKYDDNQIVFVAASASWNF